MLTTSENPDVNYLAQIVRLETVIKHPNADKLQLTTVCGAEVVTGLQAKEGDLYVYFPIECQIDHKYLCWSNSYSDSARNQDPMKKGFFHKQGRVKMVKLRDKYSNGYIVPVSDLEDYIKEFYGKTYNINIGSVGKSFDTVAGDRFVKKFVRNVRNQSTSTKKSKGKLKKYETKIVEGQFAFHEDTLNLRKEIAKIKPDDHIVIEEKIHGSSFIVSKVLVKKKLSLVSKIARFFGAKVEETEYGNLFASRTVIKNSRIDPYAENSGFYDSNIWKIVSDRVYPHLDNGVSLYGEVFGFTPTGSYIQPKYDYGCPPRELNFIIYKGTLTLPDGKVYVMSQAQLEAYCAEKGFSMARKYYDGKAKDLFPGINTHNHWHQSFLQALEKEFLEKKCIICKNDVWAEGIVIKRQIPFVWDTLKLKSLNFLGYETSMLDSDEVSVDEEESASNEDSVEEGTN